MASATLDLRTVAVGSYQENCYVLVDPATDQALVFDPGAEPERILPLIGTAQVTAILLTHAHADHIGAVDAVHAATGAPVSIHAAELPALGAVRHDTLLGDGDTLAFGAHAIRAIHTPGHTPGMLTFVVDERIAIVGDTIFAGGPGRTWSAADFATTLRTLRDTILGWPDSYTCYPGHGPAFAIGDIRSRVERFVAREHPAGFYGDAEW